MSKTNLLKKYGRTLFQRLMLACSLLFMGDHLFAQGVISDLTNPSNLTGWEEEIKIIAPSRKIFIITNQSQGLAQGDFITLMLGRQKVVRTLVVKTTQDRVGLKVVRVYNQSLWHQSQIGDSFLIIRGDDSYYSADSNQDDFGQRSSGAPRGSQEDDFYLEGAETEEDLQFLRSQWGGLPPESKGHLENHMLSFGWGVFQSIDRNDDSSSYNKWIVTYGYQIMKDIFIEGGLSTAPMKKFPAVDLNSQIFQLTVTGKYTIKLPAHFYLQPYLGLVFSTLQHSAGTPGVGRTQQELDEELRLISRAEGLSLAAGASLYRKLVPGWLARIDLGINSQSLHIVLEF